MPATQASAVDSGPTSLPILRGAVDTVAHECHARLGLTSEELQAKSPTVDEFFDAIAGERLRRMPADGSRLDSTLRRASRLAFAVASLRDSVTSFMDGAEDATKMIWGTTLLLLEMGIDNIEMIDTIFSRFGRVTLGISYLLQQENDFQMSRALQQEVAEIYAHLLQLVVHISVEYRQVMRTQNWQSMHEVINHGFFCYFNRFTIHWRRIRKASWTAVKSKMQHVDLETVYQFLEIQDRPLQMLLESQAHSLADGSFSWFESHLTTFTVGPRSLMLVRGNPGAGKSALAQWTIERLQVSSEYDIWNVIPIVIRSDVHITTLTLSILKGILIQMLDCCVTSRKTQDDIIAVVAEAITEAETGASDPQVEGLLWTAIRTAAQSNLHFMIVVDGMDQIRHATNSVGAFLELLQATVVDTPSKLIIFTRPLSKEQIPIRETKTTHQVAMDASITESDLKASIRDLVTYDPAFAGLSLSQRQPLIRGIEARSQGCFIWAQLAVEAVRAQHTYSDMHTAVNEIPNNLGGLIDLHLRSTNLQRPGTHSLLAWLTVAERPLRPNEVEQLLSVNTQTHKLSTWSGNVERDVFEPLRRLITLRDGFVTFRHPIVREHIQARAQMKKVVTFTLGDAHHDLLIRSLTWVRRNLTDEIPVSWDKMTVLARDRYLDAFILLEYTARYWMSHMLSSSMAVDDELSYSQAFQRALPDSVLFAQLELTNQESQFSRSSITTLYKIAVTVRRDVLGMDSPAVLQSLIISARAADRAQAPWANDHLYDAWTRSRMRLGPTDTITHDLEQLLVATAEGAGKADRAAGLRTDALRGMALDGWESSDISFAQRLQYLDRLVKACEKENKHDKAYDVSKQFYHKTVKVYGPYSSETMAAAEYLTNNFRIAPPDDLALELAQTKYETMVRSMDASDPRRVEYSLSLAKMYEENSQPARAEEVLTKLWQSLYGPDKEHKAPWDQKTKVVFYYSKFLKRQGNHDDAAALLRQLSTDLEAEGGVRSSAMASRAQQLRREAREMQLYDMDRALGMQLWKYYRSTDQMYHHDAITLARSLTEGAIPAEGHAADMGNLSVEENKMLPEWIDSIASAATDEASRRMPLLRLCHQLARQHMKDGQWQQGSEIVCAVLKHTWPSFEDPASKDKFSCDEAPTMADLAQDHAYCLFRRLDVPAASVVYGNAFKAAITAEQVEVQSVTTVVKTVVDFYESTFQFDKALVLLRQVSEFFASRLGEKDKHTLDSRYYEGDLAFRLDRRIEAESSYRHIYKASIKDGKIAASGVRAAVALVALYEQNKNWDAALEVYRHLWPTLVRFDEKDGYDRALLEGLLPKTYSAYMSLLMHPAIKAGYTERLQVASEHQQLCRKLYGPTHARTRDATLSVAGLSAESDQHSGDAIHLYQQVLNTHDWVPQSEATHSLKDMKDPLSIDIKHRMAQLYLRHRQATPEARKLYMEELALAKQQQGLSAPTTLQWLQEICRMYSSSESTTLRQQGAKILGGHAEEVIRVTGNQQTLADRGRKLAEIYLECGYIDEGNALISSLRQQVIEETPATHRQALDEHRPAVFVAAFEEVFGKRQSAREILDELTHEGQVYNNFQQSLTSHDLMPTLAAGDKLLRLQNQQKQTQAAKNTEVQLYQYFCNTLSVARPMRSKEVVQVFYSMCRRESLNENYTFDIVTELTGLVKDMCNASRFEDAAVVTGVFHSFAHLTDSLRAMETIFTAVKLCLYLSGYQVNKCTDEGVAKRMSVESEMLLQGIMKTAKELPLQFTELPFTELNDLITVLGEHEMFEDLESILTELWTSRMIQKTWSLSAVVWIGRRLVETRFCRGHVNAATQLGKDICYNLRQVWGNTDPVTLEMNKLLSGLYTASGNYLAAAALHETALAELLNSDEHGKNGAVEAVTQHLELLQHAQMRLAKEGQSAAIDAATAQERVQQIATKFGLPIERLQAASNDESVGMWQRPRRFSLDVEEAAKHENHLRQSSGSALLTGNGGAKRISITAL
ncbi:tetratricopeptide repeat protein [Aspergillus mulundensis]|uniref:Nephrocystin 3-like N-terminal domain-containing protein n=1 Tax=Aspergillus mulundensis TaxID=1810919 RepID=A0A3D8R9I1_9EURO|nr:hypothetical protein DSM5745_08196 [Aspergillus mulundensis]RDW70685.1 hypothetical protein DSM5745_08196 [Aspergillus mulundensis]